MHKFTNGDTACSELGWRPARARVQLQQFSYMWRLVHEAPAHTHELHRVLGRPRHGQTPDVPWTGLVRRQIYRGTGRLKQDMVAVMLSADVLGRCGSMGSRSAGRRALPQTLGPAHRSQTGYASLRRRWWGVPCTSRLRLSDARGATSPNTMRAA
jgi:hypothetical protein